MLKQITPKTCHSDTFNPYEENSGTSLSLKQKDYIIVAADTRNSSEMGINSRNSTKIYKIGSFLLTTTGFYADGYDLNINLVYEVNRYKHRFNKEISIHATAHLLCNLLYNKRFFPYYSYCSLSGFDNGVPYIYGYDPVGSYESVDCRVNGSGASMVQPLLDSVISKKNWENCALVYLSPEDALKLVRKAFNAACERDVKTGDNLEVYLMKVDSVERNVYPLRRD